MATHETFRRPDRRLSVVGTAPRRLAFAQSSSTWFPDAERSLGSGRTLGHLSLSQMRASTNA